MDTITIFLIAVGLSMDAFAVAICKGLAVGKVTLRNILTVGIWFGGFQAVMPVLGYYLGVQFKDSITAVDHWIAFILLVVIGVNMIRESLSDDDERVDSSTGIRTMLVLAVATSIDALAIGISFAFLDVDIFFSAVLIGVTTFVLSVVGMIIGSTFGAKYKSKAEFVGGVILIVLGTKIFLEHLGFF
ncbi:MAG: manganese efflux pump MntP family protein [Candidatus Methanomethylophilaceae archaeon]